jgi:hypothetical protein
VSLLVIVSLIGASVAASLAFPERKHKGTLAADGDQGPGHEA